LLQSLIKSFYYDWTVIGHDQNIETAIVRMDRLLYEWSGRIAEQRIKSNEYQMHRDKAHLW
jgi:hypothetical protein